MKKESARKPNSQPTGCAIYARTATVKKPNEHNSITWQVGKCNRFAKGTGWIVKEDCIFTDSGKSGLNLSSGLRDLLRIIAGDSQSIGVLLCTSIDRIARDTSLAIRIQRSLEEYGVDIRFVDSDDSSPSTKST
jgi:DNA invertase Pin-like site-specific DNA recombinase